MDILVGLDIGTSGIKAIAMDKNGVVESSEYIFNEVESLKEDWAEQNPEYMWKSSIKCLKKLNADISGEDRIIGIGVTGQMHGTILLNDEMEVMCPAIIWCDKRSKDLLKEINLITKNLSHELTNPIITGVQASTLYWLKKYNKNLFDKIRCVMLPKDYIRYKLTGNIGTEPSDASGTLLFNVDNGKWDFELIELLEYKKEWFPKVHDSFEIAGEISDNVSFQTGLTKGVKVVFGGGDASVQSFALGGTADGQLLSSVRSGGDVIAISDSLIYDSEKRYLTLNHIIKGEYIQLAATLSSGLALKWYCNNIVEMNDFKEIDRISELVFNDEIPIFLPYLIGERTPIMDPYAKGAFFGLSLKHGKDHLALAIMEGIIFSLYDCYCLLKSQGIKCDSIIVSGGGANSKVFLRLWSNIFNVKIKKSILTDQAPIGAAMMAGIAIGVYSSIEQARALVCNNEIIDISPEKCSVERYKKRFEIYKTLYNNTKEIMKLI